MPHLTEEIYSLMYAEDDADSIHLSRWPEADDSLIDEEAERRGDLIVSVIRDIRREKNKQGIPLNTPIEALTIYAGDDEVDTLRRGSADISATVKAEKIEVVKGEGGDFEVEGYPNICFSFLSIKTHN